MTSTSQPVAVVTGASSGIGAATARRLATEGFHVVLAARRLERLHSLAAAIAGTPVRCDVTSDEDVRALAETVAALGRPCHVLVNNAGGALGLDPVESSPIDDWQRMYDSNVIGTLRVTQALLPALEYSRQGTIVMITSTAGHATYPRGGGYVAAKSAQARLTETLRWELVGRPVRVIEICPGLVATEEFSLVRFGGDATRAEQVYEGVAEPLVADDIADCVAWCVSRPHHVNIDRLVVRPLAQANNTTLHRGPISARSAKLPRPRESPGGIERSREVRSRPGGYVAHRQPVLSGHGRISPGGHRLAQADRHPAAALQRRHDQRPPCGVRLTRQSIDTGRCER